MPTIIIRTRQDTKITMSCDKSNANNAIMDYKNNRCVHIYTTDNKEILFNPRDVQYLWVEWNTPNGNENT